MEVQVIISGIFASPFEWPDDWPLPRAGDEVDTGADWLVVESVVWRLAPDVEPYVSINLQHAVVVQK